MQTPSLRTGPLPTRGSRTQGAACGCGSGALKTHTRAESRAVSRSCGGGDGPRRAVGDTSLWGCAQQPPGSCLACAQVPETWEESEALWAPWLGHTCAHLPHSLGLNGPGSSHWPDTCLLFPELHLTPHGRTCTFQSLLSWFLGWAWQTGELGKGRGRMGGRERLGAAPLSATCGILGSS